MIVFIYIIISAACSFILCFFSFWVGRCSRKLPMIDNNLPWTMNREQSPRCTGGCEVRRTSPPGPPRWPDERLLPVAKAVRPQETSRMPETSPSHRTVNFCHWLRRLSARSHSNSAEPRSRSCQCDAGGSTVSWEELPGMRSHCGRSLD